MIRYPDSYDEDGTAVFDLTDEENNEPFPEGMEASDEDEDDLAEDEEAEEESTEMPIFSTNPRVQAALQKLLRK
jgi:hypothetical protein